MSFPPYGSYEDSSVDWIGQVPTAWQVVPLKAAVSVVGGATPKSDVADYWDAGVPWITPGDLSRLETPFIGDTIRTISEAGLASCAATRVPAGSVILSTRAPIGSLGITTEPATTNQGCKALVPRHDTNARFLAYTLSTATTALNVRGKGTTFLELSGDELARFKVPLPSAAEQSAIAAFLDRETAKIDALVEAQRLLIELLKEKRQAVISHAVTKGLDPAAPMKDCGVEWLGEVPAHWEVVKLSRFVSARRPITYGIVQAGPHVDDGVPYIRPADMSDEEGVLDAGALLRTSPEIAEAYRRSRIQTGDLICSIGPSFGKLMIVPPALEGANLTQGTARVAVAEPSSVRFAFWALRSASANAQWEASIGGATFRALNLEPLARTILARPPWAEQVAIAEFLDREIDRLDRLASEAREGISLLLERRAALISAAVTGKIDVRGLVLEQAEAA